MGDNSSGSGNGNDKQGGGGGGVAMDRRSFLKVTGLTASAAGLGGCEIDVGPPIVIDPRPAPRTFEATVYRPLDLVALKFEFYGLVPNAAGDTLVPQGPGQRLIVVSYPKQHIIEQAFLEDPSGPQAVLHPVGSMLSGPSRVVFKVPAGTSGIDFDLEVLLARLREYELQVSDHAAPPDPNLPKLGGGGGIIIIGAGSSGPTRIGGTAQRAREKRTLSRLSRSSGVSLQIAEPDPRVGPIFAQINPGKPEEPTELETALELPFRLLISPNHLAGFTHSPSAVTANGRTELWHTRLGVRVEPQGDAVPYVDEHDASLRTIRALWARDMPDAGPPLPPPPPPPAVPFTASLTGNDRKQFVIQTSDFDHPIKPRPVDVDRLMLTTLGGWLKSRGEWEFDRPVAAWDHRATMGRDHYVRVIRNGYLYPFGHRAVLFKITERKLLRSPHPEATADTARTAYLWQRFFIVIKEPAKSYKKSIRNITFPTIVFKDLVTPNLDAPIDETQPFAPFVDGDPLYMSVEAVDRDGRIIPFKAAFVWCPVAESEDEPGKIILGNADDLYEDRRDCLLDGKRVAFAESENIDDTTYEVASLNFKKISDGSGNNTPGIAPALRRASLRVEAMRALTGDGTGQEFEYADVFMNNGFSGLNATGQVLLKVVGALDMSFGNSEKSGGFMAPNLSITGLSRKRGPVGGNLDKFGNGEFKPKEFFDKIDAKIFGVFQLGDILTELGVDNAPTFITQAFDQVEAFLNGLAELPSLLATLAARFTTEGMPPVPSGLAGAVSALEAEILDGVGALKDIEDIDVAGVTAALAGLLTEVNQLPKQVDGLMRVLASRIGTLQGLIGSDLVTAIGKFLEGAELAKDLTVRLEWRPEITQFLDGLFQPNDKHGLLLSVEARGKDLPGKPAGVDLVASIENFTINLFGLQDRFLSIPFEKLQFRVASGKKPEIDVIFSNMVFDGVLAFVQKLTEILPLDGFSDPPNVTVDENGITAGFTIPLPNIAIGVFSLENISISAGFNIPFIGPPVTVNFGFCTREQPFVLTVCMLGGGGFFGLHVSPNGVELLEAALEFGASLSIDFGVASGGISIMAGIYFAMEQDNCTLSGYLRMRGEVDVLGLISASIELRMELTYQFSSKKCIGKATIEIEVSVLCFSGTVEITAEKKFSGSNEDPTFADVMDKAVSWPEYVAAFAA
jgi:hypothetical protein